MRIASVQPIQGPLYHITTDTGERLAALQMAAFENDLRVFETWPVNAPEIEHAKGNKVRLCRWFLADLATGIMIPTISQQEADRRYIAAAGSFDFSAGEL